MSLSMHGETIFHFTERFETLAKIISEMKFNACYCSERLIRKEQGNNKNITPSVWVPMVSFCDYKLSEIGHHALNYGNYAVGMSKRWGIKNGLNPVFYISTEFEYIHEPYELNKRLAALRDLIMGDCKCDNNSSQISNELLDLQIKSLNLYAWTKNYQGPLVRRGRVIPDFRFADDKEWRYVAKFREKGDNEYENLYYEIIGRMGFLPAPSIVCDCCKRPAEECQSFGKTIIRERQKQHESHLIQESRFLRFEACDIRFIVVNTNEDRSRLLDQIKDYMPPHPHGMHFAVMASKIIVIEELDIRELKPIF